MSSFMKWFSAAIGFIAMALIANLATTSGKFKQFTKPIAVFGLGASLFSLFCSFKADTAPTYDPSERDLNMAGSDVEDFVATNESKKWHEKLTRINERSVTDASKYR